MRILIVDDDADDRKVFITAVKEVDETIDCMDVSNGELALSFLQAAEELPDIIFLDLRMPRVSGKACLLAIKKDERLKQIPVYIYTTSREVEESIELKEMGAFHFISKPNNEEEVYFLVAFAVEEFLHTEKQNN